VKNCWPAKPKLRRPSQRVRRDLSCGAGTRAPRSRRVNSGRRHRWRCRTVRTWTHTRSIHPIQVRMLLSFQRPPRPVGKGFPSPDGAPERDPLGAGLRSIAPIRRSEDLAPDATPTGRGRIAPPRRKGSGRAPTGRHVRVGIVGSPARGPTRSAPAADGRADRPPHPWPAAARDKRLRRPRAGAGSAALPPQRAGKRLRRPRAGAGSAACRPAAPRRRGRRARGRDGRAATARR
jgi:hypothetical protein